MKKYFHFLIVSIVLISCSNDTNNAEEPTSYDALILRYENNLNPNVIEPKSTYIDYSTSYQFTSYFRHGADGQIDRLTHLVGDDGSGKSLVMSFDESGFINVLYQQDASTYEILSKVYVKHEAGTTYVGDEIETTSIIENVEINQFFDFLSSSDDIILSQKLNQNREILEQLTSYANSNNRLGMDNLRQSNANTSNLFSGFQVFSNNLINLNIGLGAANSNTGIGQTIYDYILYDGCNIFSTCELQDDGTFTCGSLWANVICWDVEQVSEVLENSTITTVNLCGNQICLGNTTNDILGEWNLFEFNGNSVNTLHPFSGSTVSVDCPSNPSSTDIYGGYMIGGSITFTQDSYSLTNNRDQIFNYCSTGECADPGLCWYDSNSFSDSGTYTINGNQYTVTSGMAESISITDDILTVVVSGITQKFNR